MLVAAQPFDSHGIYRIRAWALASCSSLMENESQGSQSRQKNEIQIEGNLATTAVSAFGGPAKHDSTHIGQFVSENTFTVDYDCSLDLGLPAWDPIV